MQLAWSRIIVTDVVGSLALLEIRRTAKDPAPESLGDVPWLLEYGDVTLTSGTLSRLAHGVVVPVKAGCDELDWTCVRLMAPVEDGSGPAIQGRFTRPSLRVTRAEAVARSRWPGARRQHEAPLTGVAPVGRWALRIPGLPGRSPDDAADPRVGRAVVYASAAELVEQRRTLLRAPRGSARGGPRP